MASKAHRVTKGLVGGFALLAGAVLTLSGCLSPQFTYVANSGDDTYFKVPYTWHKISDTSLNNELKSANSAGGGWTIAYEAGYKPTATDFLAFKTTQPFIFAEVGQLNSTSAGQMSDDSLRDFFFPTTQAGRQNAQQQGFPLTGFRKLRDQTLTLKQGVHGVRETFDYTYTGTADTFDVVALTNAKQTFVYLLVAHCTTSCYSKEQTQINDVMSSFTIRSS